MDKPAPDAAPSKATDTNGPARAASGGDLWGGLAAMLVALPSAIAFGVATFAALGPAFIAQGALAGLLGAIGIGLVASVVGGAPRLISAPCAPAAAVLSALALTLAGQGLAPASILLMLLLITLLAGALQVLFGLVRLGSLIKYMPYPVVSGYLSGVGLIILQGQLAKLLGTPQGTGWFEALLAPALWSWQAPAVATLTVAAMLLAPRLTQRVPSVIVALLAGVAGYFVLAWFDPALLRLEGNPLVVGRLLGEGPGLLATLQQNWLALGALDAAQVRLVLVPAATLAILLSIDTLKTCIVLDAMTRSRHDSNRTLVAQGLGNLAAGAVGGMAGAGTMGATLVNLSSGGRSRWSGVAEGLLALLAFWLLADLLAWVPIAALAAILAVIGLRMLDRDSLHYLRSRQTVLDFAVIVAVVVVALTLGLIAASGAGILLAIMLFLREQVGGRVVVRRSRGSRNFSKRVRTQAEVRLLERVGEQTLVLELQGSLFFGTTDQLYRELEPELGRVRYLVLDMRRVLSVDVTAAHMLQQVDQRLAERGASLLFSHVPARVPSGRDMQRYFRDLGLARAGERSRLFDELDDALEWIEDQWILEAQLPLAHEKPLELREMDLFAQRSQETLDDLLACMEPRSYRAGQRIFARGDGTDEIFLIRQGLVRIVLPITEGRSHHLATFGRGSFFGEMAFLDHQPRSADAMAFSDCELFVLSRQRFEQLAQHHKRLGLTLMENLARLLAGRLRHADAELNALESG